MEKEEIDEIIDYANEHSKNHMDALLCKYCLELDKRITNIEQKL